MYKLLKVLSFIYFGNLFYKDRALRLKISKIKVISHSFELVILYVSEPTIKPAYNHA